MTTSGRTEPHSPRGRFKVLGVSPQVDQELREHFARNGRILKTIGAVYREAILAYWQQVRSEPKGGGAV